MVSWRHETNKEKKYVLALPLGSALRNEVSCIVYDAEKYDNRIVEIDLFRSASIVPPIIVVTKFTPIPIDGTTEAETIQSAY